jgi:methionyl-tRNA formyltransferase
VILFFSDNRRIYEGLRAFAAEQGWDVEFACSPGTDFAEPIRIRDQVDRLIAEYDVIVSGHCKQIFPSRLVQATSCINLHPGFNPHTRGWYPQVFSIVNRLPIGFTVHLMDDGIDSGPIIYRQSVESRFWDTSRSLYERVVAAEIASLPHWLPQVVARDFTSFPPESSGNYFSRADFDALCEIDLSRTGTFEEFYNLLRGTSFPPFDNAYVRDPQSGAKVYLRLDVHKEPDAADAAGGS